MKQYIGETNRQTGNFPSGCCFLQKVLPVQKEAARTFCMFLRYNRKQEQRQEMMERLIKGQNTEFLQSLVI